MFLAQGTSAWGSLLSVYPSVFSPFHPPCRLRSAVPPPFFLLLFFIQLYSHYGPNGSFLFSFAAPRRSPLSHAGNAWIERLRCARARARMCGNASRNAGQRSYGTTSGGFFFPPPWILEDYNVMSLMPEISSFPAGFFAAWTFVRRNAYTSILNGPRIHERKYKQRRLKKEYRCTEETFFKKFLLKKMRYTRR